MREKYGSVKERERTDLTASDSEPDKWSQKKTAEALNQSEATCKRIIKKVQDDKYAKMDFSLFLYNIWNLPKMC